MRIQKCYFAGLVLGLFGLACLAGCSGGGVPTAGPVPSTSLVNPAPGPPPPAADPAVRAAARPAVIRFYAAISAARFKDSWQMLAPAAKHEISLRVWQDVHLACKPGRTVKPPVIKAVTTFGNAAIVTAIATDASSRLHTTRDVFNFADDRWGYQPAEIGIYSHGSISADLAAAKRDGLCNGWKSF